MTFVPAATLEDVLKVALPGVPLPESACPTTRPSSDRPCHPSSSMSPATASATRRARSKSSTRSPTAGPGLESSSARPRRAGSSIEACGGPSRSSTAQRATPGVVQIDSLRLDEHETIRLAADYHRHLPAHIEREAASCGSTTPGWSSPMPRRSRAPPRTPPACRPSSSQLHVGLDLRGVPRGAGRGARSDPDDSGRLPPRG